MPNLKSKSLKTKKHLTDSQQAAIDYMNTTADMSDRDFMNLIGVFGRLKPASMLYPNSKSILSSYRQLASDLGLYFEEVSNQHDKFPLLLVAAKKSDLDNLFKNMHQFFKRTEDVFSPELERSIGRLVGYPDSAIEYYIKRLAQYHQTGELSDFVELPAEYIEYEPFVEFILSPENYPAEIASYVEPLRQSTKTFAPELYERIVKG